jgi:hypothetical protein
MFAAISARPARMLLAVGHARSGTRLIANDPTGPPGTLSKIGTVRRASNLRRQIA